MSESKHTPGPWHWVNPRTDAPREAGEYFSSLRTVAEFKSRHGDYTLPKFILDVEEIRDENMEANACLIAAAPDLLEALQKLRHAVCGETGFASAVRTATNTAYPWPALDLAEQAAAAAIAKAEGRS